MNILIIVTLGEIGGAQMSILLLATELARRGIQVTVGLGPGQYLKEELAERRLPSVHFKWLRRTVNPLVNLFFIWELKRFLDTNKFEVVHLNSTNALFGAVGVKFSRFRPKTVFTFRGLSLLDPHHNGSRFGRGLNWLSFRFFLSFVDQPVFVCQSNLEAARKMKLVKTGRVIENGINLEAQQFLQPEDARLFFAERLGSDLAHNFIIGSIGRLAYPKNYEFLIRQFPAVLRNNPEAICILVGDGPERKKHESLIQVLGLQKNLFLLGELKGAAKFLPAFDLFVLPSIYEGMSVTLIEALIAGLPILASRVGGNQELLSEAGLVYELDNQDQFLEKIRRVMEDRVYRDGLRAAARARGWQFSIQRTAEQYLSVYGSRRPHQL